MPFIAIDTYNDGQRVDATDYDDLHEQFPRDERGRDRLLCQLCRQPMFPREGSYAAHFVHYQECTSDYKAHPESREHRAGKRFVRDHLREIYPEARVELEVPIESRKRIADVLVVFESGWWVAHEVQLASITPRKLEERTRDYALEGIDVTWWFGSNMTVECRQWVKDRDQAIYILDFEEIPDDED